MDKHEYRHSIDMPRLSEDGISSKKRKQPILNSKMLLNEDEGLKVGPRGDFENKRRNVLYMPKSYESRGVAQQKKG